MDLYSQSIPRVCNKSVYNSYGSGDDLTPQAQFYYELDCRHRMYRVLSMTLGSEPEDAAKT
jgi:hypothetical protein